MINKVLNPMDLSLLDEEFLSALTEQKEREIYARIASLDINELPIEYIEGKVTGGSINVDGDSAIRRTCSLTMISEEVDINDYYWGVRTKFKLEIGLKNNLGEFYKDYPEIIWFPAGTYILTSFNTSLSTNNCSISLSGKDKMCMVNGELGGQIFASVDFGQEEEKITIMKQVDTVGIASSELLMQKKYYFLPEQSAESVSLNNKNYKFIESADGTYRRTDMQYEKAPADFKGHKYTKYQLVLHPSELFEEMQGIYEAGKYYYENNEYYILSNTQTASSDKYFQLKPIYQIDYEYNIKKIPLEKIIRESVHTYAKEPYHNIIINDLNDYGLEQLTYKGDKKLYALRDKETGHFTQMFLEGKNTTVENEMAKYHPFHEDSLTSETTGETGDIITLNGKEYTVAIFEYGDDIGYRVTDLTYTGDLISNIGESLISILDKIKQMLGDFEYFYDLDGRFIFQRKQTYVNTSWSQITDNKDEKYVTYYNDKKKFSFNFEGNRLVTAINNQPVLTNLKNDFSVWGKRKEVSGEDIAIHARYAIDKKPVFYTALNGISYTTDEKYVIEALHIPTSEAAINGLLNEIRNFTQQQTLPTFLSPPRRLKDGSWSAGWWDIRDWANYYSLLTGRMPIGTMKFYSAGDETGCVAARSLGGRFANVATNAMVWLIEITPSGSINTGHGYGPYGSGSRECTYYESYYEDGNLQTEKTSQKKTFTYPYAGCSDTHTYLYFLNQITKYGYQGVYFYNPKFPNVTYDELIENKKQLAYEEWLRTNQIKIVDWREIIYQMAKDYFAGQGCSNDYPLYLSRSYYDDNQQLHTESYTMTNPDYFLSEVALRNPNFYPTGYTGYEQYYTDMEGFWRQLYNPDYEPELIYSAGKYIDTIVPIDNSIYYRKEKQWSDKKITDINIQYYIPSFNFDIIPQDTVDREKIITKINKYIASPLNDAVKDRLYWNINVFENPEVLDFWIEFFEDGDELSQFAIPQVGDRSKVVNDDKISAIIFKEIPDIILYDRFTADKDNNLIPDTSNLRKKLEEETGYTWIYLPKGFSQYLTISYRSISAKNKIDELLYQYAYCIENISITALPVYHLQPNTRIYVYDEKTKINGEYIVSKLTIPLTYNGTMSITAVKAPERFY